MVRHDRGGEADGPDGSDDSDGVFEFYPGEKARAAPRIRPRPPSRPHSPETPHDSGRGDMTATDRKGFDPLLIVMVVGFVMAVGAMAWPAFRADPMSAPGLVLIFTAGAV